MIISMMMVMIIMMNMAGKCEVVFLMTGAVDTVNDAGDDDDNDEKLFFLM